MNIIILFSKTPILYYMYSRVIHKTMVKIQVNDKFKSPQV